MPLQRQVAGVAMGLIADEAAGQYTILTDILGSEDAMGDMDFKVAGGPAGHHCLPAGCQGAPRLSAWVTC